MQSVIHLVVHEFVGDHDKEQEESSDEEDENEAQDVPADVQSHTSQQIVAPSKTLVDATTRCNSILEVIGEHSILPAEFFKQCVLPQGGTTKAQEVAAFRRLFRGYSNNVNEQEWDALWAATIGITPTSWSDVLTGSAHVDEEDDFLSKALMRQKTMVDAYAMTETQLYSEKLFLKIEAIKFAHDFADKAVGPGGMQFKQQFYADRQYRKQYSLFKRSIENDIKARNRLLHIYLHFGTPVLLDSHWCISNLRNGTHNFATLLNLLITNTPRVYPSNGTQNCLSAVQEGSTKLLLEIANRVDETFFNYLEAFLADYPSNVPSE
ncbi:hypothetical protein A0H81_04196 [Grifola frondosa]|uniref:Uncharacterized protein n=1 Tax=Grifola frondosa TaxID=5627 RepID=A0A1C7MDU0_GRIFR|nr:hypothetical protein A0H81_04196 [Grifola frondosa]